MAIQMRRGLRKDFDPSKMLPGEWAVSIDSSTSNQIVWMCFAAGICKRMGTYEDFQAQIAEATKDIRDSYVSDFNEIKADIELIANTVSSDKEEVLIIKSDIVNTYLPQIQGYTERAETASSSAELSANNSSNSATLSQSYAVGGTGTREGENADNAKYYYEQAKHISQGGNGLVPMGTIAFEGIPTTDIVTNAMYNISNDFTSDERFIDGGGVLYGKGSNIFYTLDGLWDVLAASDVKGVKGAAEDTYRQGNVNITPANIGLGNVDNTADVDKPISNAVQIALDEVNNVIDTIESDLTKAEEAIQKNADDIATTNNNFEIKEISVTAGDVSYDGTWVEQCGKQVIVHLNCNCIPSNKPVLYTGLPSIANGKMILSYLGSGGLSGVAVNNGRIYIVSTDVTTGAQSTISGTISYFTNE